MPQRKLKRTKDRCTIERVYRKLLAVEKDVVNQLAIIRLDLRPVREHVPILTQHCERLMREKITLQKQVESANRYMNDPARHHTEITRWPISWKFNEPIGKCAVQHLHRPGIVCGVCGSIQVQHGPP